MHCGLCYAACVGTVVGRLGLVEWIVVDGCMSY